MEGMNPGMAMGGAPATELMMVPDKMVGLIIGRGGEQITRLQAESGCKIQMAQDSQGNLDYKTLILMRAHCLGMNYELFGGHGYTQYPIIRNGDQR